MGLDDFGSGCGDVRGQVRPRGEGVQAGHRSGDPAFPGPGGCWPEPLAAAAAHQRPATANIGPVAVRVSQRR